MANIERVHLFGDAQLPEKLASALGIEKKKGNAQAKLAAQQTDRRLT
jgi:hypothetical protein